MEIDDLDPDPQVQLERWLADAREADPGFPEAAALATATPDGVPSVRMVLLKGQGGDGLVFFTSTASRKAEELAANPRAAMVLYWRQLARQARIEGSVETLGRSDTEAYFATRPRGSQLSAWASPQSRPVVDRADLERLVAEADARFAGQGVPLPPHWGGYRLVASAIELWHSREDRLHDRIRYDRGPGGWKRTRLGP